MQKSLYPTHIILNPSYLIVYSYLKKNVPLYNYYYIYNIFFKIHFVYIFLYGEGGGVRGCGSAKGKIKMYQALLLCPWYFFHAAIAEPDLKFVFK